MDTVTALSHLIIEKAPELQLYSHGLGHWAWERLSNLLKVTQPITKIRKNNNKIIYFIDIGIDLNNANKPISRIFIST